MDGAGYSGRGVSRRTFVQRAGLAGLGAALAQLPVALDARGLLDSALAQTGDFVEDTFNGFVAFATPGDDAYSRHQGDDVRRPGGVASGAPRALISDLDNYVHASALGAFGATVPASGGVAALLNHYAREANPVASGPFPSHYARLRRAEKADAYRRWETDPQWHESSMRAISSVLLGFATFLAWSEAGVFAPRRRDITRTPVGWSNSRYDGPAEGRPELKGYYRGRRKVRG